MWPVSAFVMVLITMSMAELASAYPVAGAMASWAWKVARGGVRGERYWGWVMSGITMGYHVAVVRRRACFRLEHADICAPPVDEPHHRASVWTRRQHGSTEPCRIRTGIMAHAAHLPGMYLRIPACRDAHIVPGLRRHLRLCRVVLVGKESSVLDRWRCAARLPNF